MENSAKDKVSSFLQILQQISLSNQFPLLQSKVETLAGQEARLVAIAERALFRVNSNHEQKDVATATGVLPCMHSQPVI